MTTTTTTKALADALAAERPRRASDVPGFELPWDPKVFPESERVSAFNLHVLLRGVAGAVEDAGYLSSHVHDRARWRSLRQAPADEVSAAVRRVERLADSLWRLPGDPSQPILDRIDDFFERLLPL